MRQVVHVEGLSSSLKVSPLCLVKLYGFEKCLEVSRTESLSTQNCRRDQTYSSKIKNIHRTYTEVYAQELAEEHGAEMRLA